MAQQPILGCQGLWTAPNLLSGRPDGSLVQAINFHFNRLGAARLRLGQITRGSNAFDGAIDGLTTFQGYPIVTSSAVNKIGYYDWTAGTYTTLSGSYEEINSNTHPIRFTAAARNLYFTTTSGIYRLDAYNGTPIKAGVAPPLSIETATGGATAGWLADPGTVAYRATVKFKDANGNWHTSAPCGRAVFRNSGLGTVAVGVTVRFVASLSTSYWLQIYRSKQTVSATDEPSDEMGLVYEAALSSSDVTNKYVTITDQVPDVMRGASGYFSPSQEGIGQANYPPPLARDVALFRECLFYARTTNKHRITLRLLSVGSPNGIQDADTVTIAGTVYTAKTTPTTDQHFAIISSGSAQTNAQGTALNLVKAVNTAAANTSVYAYYISNADDAAGIIAIEERSIGGSSYALIGSRATCWVPQLPSSGTAVSSANDATPNRIYVSKSGEPEAVPLLQYLDVGAANMEIHRIVPLRDSLIVFKEDGAYRLTGEGPSSFRVSALDPTLQLLGPRTAQPLRNQVLGYTDQGLVSISEAGARLLSVPVELDMVSTVDALNSWAVASEAQGKYWFSPNPGDALPLYVYDIDSDTWSTDSRVPKAGAWDATNRVMLWGSPSVSKIYNDYGNPLSASLYGDDGSAIAGTLTWLITGGASGRMKHFREVAFYFYKPLAQTVTVGFTTDLVTTEVTTTASVVGDGTPRTGIVRVSVPQSMQHGNHLAVRLTTGTLSKWCFVEGIEPVFEILSERTTR